MTQSNKRRRGAILRRQRDWGALVLPSCMGLAAFSLGFAAGGEHLGPLVAAAGFFIAGVSFDAALRKRNSEKQTRRRAQSAQWLAENTGSIPVVPPASTQAVPQTPSQPMVGLPRQSVSNAYSGSLDQVEPHEATSPTVNTIDAGKPGGPQPHAFLVAAGSMLVACPRESLGKRVVAEPARPAPLLSHLAFLPDRREVTQSVDENGRVTVEELYTELTKLAVTLNDIQPVSAVPVVDVSDSTTQDRVVDVRDGEKENETAASDSKSK